MAPPRKSLEDKKVVTSFALTPKVIEALKKEARGLAVRLERNVTPSQLVEHLVLKYLGGKK